MMEESEKVKKITMKGVGREEEETRRGKGSRS
jgi:hypothetical protein